MKIGDTISIVGVTAPAIIQEIHADGAVDAQISEAGHPQDGAITHVLPGNFSAVDEITSPAATKQPQSEVTAAAAVKENTVAVGSPKVEQLGKYCTVTRG